MFQVLNVDRLHSAVEESMKILNDAPIVEGENQDRREKQKELSLVINVNDVSDPTISMAIPCGLYELVEYELEFIDGVRDYETSWDYTYHQLFSPYLEYCINELLRNNTTRRAILPIAGSKSYGNQHPPCLQVIMFRIRNGKLNTSAVFRSNDGVKAFAMNSFAIVRLAQKIADKIGVSVGEYSHIAYSFHAYQKDWEQLYAYCKLFEERSDNGLCTYFTMQDYMQVYEEYADSYRDYCKYRKQKLKNKGVI